MSGFARRLQQGANHHPGGGATVPGAPTGVSATGGNASATVTFTAPASNGGSTITGYTATSSPGSHTGSITGATASPITVNGLTNGTAYTFTVHATNAKGNSVESAPSGSVTPTASWSGTNAWANPSAAGWPDATNTGWQYTGVTLTTHSGNYTASTASAVIDSLDISGQVLISANNVTIKRCRITVSSIDSAAVINTGSYTGTVIQDCEIIGGSGTTHGSYNGVQTGSATVQRCNIHNFENPIEAGDGLSLQDSYLHGFIADYAGAEPHYDGVECGSGSNFTVNHNTIDNDSADDQTSAINFSGDFGSISNVTITNNLLRGGTYVIYLDKKSNSITGVTLDNNRFGRTQQYGTLDDTGASYTHSPSGNVYDDNNSVAI